METKKNKRSFRGRRVGEENKGGVYFSDVEEQAIIEYRKCGDSKRRDEIYSKIIHPAMVKLIENVVNVYKFYLPNIEELKSTCLERMTMVLSKYDENRNSKAFSYFTVSAKNFFIAEYKKNQEEERRGKIINSKIELEGICQKDVVDELIDKKIFYDSVIENFEYQEKIMRKNSNYYRVFRKVWELVENPEILTLNGVDFHKDKIVEYMSKELDIDREQLVSILYRMKRKIFPYNQN